jgi:hypothetical protein
MSNRDDRKGPPTDERLMGGQNMSMAGPPLPAEPHRAEREEGAEEREEEKKVKLSEQPSAEYRLAAPKEPEEEHRLITEAHRWGKEGTSREVRGYPREGELPENRPPIGPTERKRNPRE